jgi:adenylosuccinate lyase
VATREQLFAVGTLDGRDASQVENLRPIVSEFGLIKGRVAVHAGWLSILGSGTLPDREPLSDSAQKTLAGFADQFTAEDAMEIKKIEDRINHDSNAVVRWLKEKLGSDARFDDYTPLVHFGRTSEDPTNLAYAMMIRDARDEVLIPGINSIEQDLREKAGLYAEVPMLAHTHGQPAVPTTLGKEMAVFAKRLEASTRNLGSVTICGKFNGASGNFNADMIAYPDVNWPVIMEYFVNTLGFEFNGVTTQIEPHDWIVRFGNELTLSNSILTDLSRDMWAYISMKYLTQKVVKEDDGSSAMPQKVNPINFEKGESNCDSANNILQGLARKLPISRLQRDLSDSSSLRTIGNAFGHSVVAHREILKGLGKVYANELKMAEDLNEEWAILTEPVQTVMRKHGIAEAYDLMKEFARGKTVTRESYIELIEAIDGIAGEDHERLLNLTPENYLGDAANIAHRVSNGE